MMAETDEVEKIIDAQLERLCAKGILLKNLGVVRTRMIRFASERDYVAALAVYGDAIDRWRSDAIDRWRSDAIAQWRRSEIGAIKAEIKKLKDPESQFMRDIQARIKAHIKADIQANIQAARQIQAIIQAAHL